MILFFLDYRRSLVVQERFISFDFMTDLPLLFPVYMHYFLMRKKYFRVFSNNSSLAKADLKTFIKKRTSTLIFRCLDVNRIHMNQSINTCRIHNNTQLKKFKSKQHKSSMSTIFFFQFPEKLKLATANHTHQNPNSNKEVNTLMHVKLTEKTNNLKLGKHKGQH